jgi:hypothetical protein
MAVALAVHPAHPPTNRVGDQVPTMKSAENEDDRTEPTTTNSDSSSN